MKKAFPPLAALTGLMFVSAPFVVAYAPFDSTMGLVSKIFYFHVPSWFAMFTAIGICGVASLVHLFTSSAKADRISAAAAEITAEFGLIGRVGRQWLVSQPWRRGWGWEGE